MAVSYNNPDKFREECVNLYRYALSSSSRKKVFETYCLNMGMYFLLGDYEYRKTAIRFRNKLMSM